MAHLEMIEFCCRTRVDSVECIPCYKSYTKATGVFRLYDSTVGVIQAMHYILVSTHLSNCWVSYSQPLKPSGTVWNTVG